MKARTIQKGPACARGRGRRHRSLRPDGRARADRAANAGGHDPFMTYRPSGRQARLQGRTRNGPIPMRAARGGKRNGLSRRRRRTERLDGIPVHWVRRRIR